jgi:hypothetical protein
VDGGCGWFVVGQALSGLLSQSGADRIRSRATDLHGVRDAMMLRSSTFYVETRAIVISMMALGIIDHRQSESSEERLLKRKLFCQNYTIATFRFIHSDLYKYGFHVGWIFLGSINRLAILVSSYWVGATGLRNSVMPMSS